MRHRVRILVAPNVPSTDNEPIEVPVYQSDNRERLGECRMVRCREIEGIGASYLINFVRDRRTRVRRSGPIETNRPTAAEIQGGFHARELWRSGISELHVPRVENWCSRAVPCEKALEN